MRKLVFLGVFMMLIFNAAMLFHFVSFDGLHGVFFRKGFGDSAVFSEGYSWYRFWRVKEGDNEQRVKELLGMSV